MTKLLSFIGWSIINLLGRTLRTRIINPFTRQKNNFAFAFWHGEQFIPCFTRKGEEAVIMSSLSKDGEIQAGILERLGFKVVRGSSTRGGQRALVEMIRYVKRGHDAGFAVDGPKGPSREIKPGVLYLAQKCRIPVVPMSCAAKNKVTFAKAWDQYELPLPFSRAVAAYGAPVYVSEGDDIGQKTAELSSSLEALSAFSHTGYWSEDVKEFLSGHPRPKILIVQPSRIGDVVFTEPSVHALRKKYPNAWIGWVTDERCAPVLEGNKDVDEVIVFDRRRLSPGYIYRTFKYLRSKDIDLSIDFHGLAKSAFMVLLAGARFRLASSSTNGMREFSWLFSEEIKPSSPAGGPAKAAVHCVDRHFAVAERLGCSPEDKVFNVVVGARDSAAVESKLLRLGMSPGKPYAVIHPGGGWLSRRWFPERFAKLIEKISKETGIQTVLVGGKEGGANEKGLNGEIIGLADAKVIDLTGELDLKELSALLKNCSVFVANEAGPMHIATALSVPSVAILGPTDAARTGPFGGETTVIQHNVECQPCRERNCAKMECMKLVTVDEVYNAVREKLNER